MSRKLKFGATGSETEKSYKVLRAFGSAAVEQLKTAVLGEATVEG